MALRLAAPAKLNLGLRVVGRRPDGYHELDGVFAPLELADELEVALDADGRGVVLALEGPEAKGVPAGAENLGVRAAHVWLQAAEREAGVRLRLVKRVPAAAGLGGGSSDAAAVLRALCALAPGVVEPARLPGLALSLGADVPFFLDPRPARVRGIGERIDPLPELPALPLLLAQPGSGLASVDVYRAFDASGASLTPPEAVDTLDASAALRGFSGEAERLRALTRHLGSGLVENDLEPAATRLLPALARLRDALAACGAGAVGMSGSGPTMYGVFESAAAARKAEERLASQWRTFVTATVAARAGGGAVGRAGASPNW